MISAGGGLAVAAVAKYGGTDFLGIGTEQAIPLEVEQPAPEPQGARIYQIAFLS